MPRALRVEYPGAIYHVLDRGDRREDIFVNDVDRQDFLERMDGKLGENHSGELHRETAEQRANRIVSEELSRLGWTESDLVARRRSDPVKLAIAVRLRNETTLSVKWIAARVQIGTVKGAKSVLHRSGRRQHHHKPARADEPCVQLEFQSTV